VGETNCDHLFLRVGSQVFWNKSRGGLAFNSLCDRLEGPQLKVFCSRKVDEEMPWFRGKVVGLLAKRLSGDVRGAQLVN
jgi:hypothetical protein